MKENEKFSLNERSRNWSLLLYDDDETHIQAIEEIRKSYKYALIKHDKDTYETDTETHVIGEIKKSHYHVIIMLPNARTRKSIINDLGIQANYVERTKDINKSLEYLVHLNNPEKYQYSVDEVEGDLKVKLSELVNNKDKSEGEKVLEICNWIDNQGYILIKDIVKWTAKSGYWAEFRRSQSVMLAYVQEHNSHINANYDD